MRGYVSRLRGGAQRIRGAGGGVPGQGRQTGGHRGAVALREDRRARAGIVEAAGEDAGRGGAQRGSRGRVEPAEFHLTDGRRRASPPDRKSTRLNSSHLVISYAVFCL